MTFIKGGVAWNKGLKTGLVPRSAFKKGQPPVAHKTECSCRRCATGENHPNWKGDEVSYRNLHRWVERYLGKASHCSNDSDHKASYYHWANVSGEYRRSLEDWQALCPSCNFNDGVKIPIRFSERRITT